MKLSVPLTFVLAAAMYAGPVTVTCDSVTADSSCSLMHSGASGRVVLTLTTDPAQWSTLTTTESVRTDAYDGDIGRQTTHSSGVTINWSQTITTAGATREGYLQLLPATAQGGDPYNGSIDMSLGFNGVSAGIVTMATCDSAYGCSPGPGYYGYYNYILVTLGTPLTLVANGTATTSAGFNEGTSDGSLIAAFQFRLIESDRVTPVAAELVSDAPEPATHGLIVLALTGAVLLRRRLSDAKL